MIKPTDLTYKNYVSSDDEKRPIIETYEEFVKLALESALANSMIAEDGEYDWNKSIRERFNRHDAVGFVNMRTFNKELLARSTEVTDIFEIQNRLDEFIGLCDDPAKKTMAMAVRKVTEPYFNSILSDELIDTCIRQKDALKNEYIIPDKLEQELENASNLSRSRKEHNVDLDTCSLSNLPTDEKLQLISRYVKSFFDREAMDGVDFENVTTAEKEFLEELSDTANRFAEAAEKGKADAGLAKSDAEVRDFKALSSSVKKMKKAQKGKFKNDVGGFKTGRNFAEMDVALKHDQVNLTLINSPMVEISAEEFLEKQKNGTLSEMEIEWGEASVDAMVKSLYTEDEYRNLVRAGYDPAMGIMIDGKPLEWFEASDFVEEFQITNEVSNTAKQKCNVIGKAMSGSKIDVYKFVPDGLNGFKKGEVVSAKTDLSMKHEEKESKGLFRWLLELLGIIPSVSTIMEKVEKANNAKRKYLKTAIPAEKTDSNSSAAKKSEESKLAQIAKRDDAATRLKVDMEQNSRNTKRFNREFFSDVFGVDTETNNEAEIDKMINDKAKDAFDYIDYVPVGKDKNGEEVYRNKEFLKTMNRTGSRVNMAILYGMTCGHTFDEMTEDSPEGAARRESIGRAFIEELSVEDYDKFIKDKGLGNDETGKKAYVDYIYDKREKAEQFALRAIEAIAREPLTRLDPFDHAQFSANYVKQHNISMLAFDLYQTIGTLNKTAVVSTDETKALTQRSSAVVNYVTAKLNPVISLEGCAGVYGNYMVSKAFVGNNESMRPDKINPAAEAKAALDVVYRKTEGCVNYSDLIYNDELNKSVTILTSQAAECNIADVKAAEQSYKDYLPTENRNTGLITIDEDAKKVVSNGNEKSFEDWHQEINAQFKTGIEAMKPYVDTEKVMKNGEKVSEAFDDKVRANKQTPRKAVTFDDFSQKEAKDKQSEETAKTTEAAKTTETAKTAEAGKTTTTPAEPQRITINDLIKKPQIYQKQSAKTDNEKVVEKEHVR